MSRACAGIFVTSPKVAPMPATTCGLNKSLRDHRNKELM